jgi:uncharacterized protein (DUF3084 family)
MIKWILGIVASLLVAGVVGSTSKVISLEGRLAKMEAQEVAAAEVRKQVREDTKDTKQEIREFRKEYASDLKDLRQTTNENQVLLRMLANRTK